MKLSVLDYVLIALIAIIVFHLLYRTFSRKYYNNENLTQLATPKNSDSKAPSGAPDVIDMDFFNMLEKNKKELELKRESKGSNCPVDVDETKIEKYIRDISFGGMFTCDNNDLPDKNAIQNPVSQEKNKVQSFRDSFWDFADKINGNSSGYDDIVDKVNDVVLSYGNEMGGLQGESIANIYDKITNLGYKNIKREGFHEESGKSEKSEKSGDSNENIYDKISGITHKNTKKGQYGDLLSDVNYNSLNGNDDSVNNGGKFYGDVEGYDDMISYESKLVGY